MNLDSFQVAEVMIHDVPQPDERAEPTLTSSLNLRVPTVSTRPLGR
jgi:hypothetical protein